LSGQYGKTWAEDTVLVSVHTNLLVLSLAALIVGRSISDFLTEVRIRRKAESALRTNEQNLEALVAQRTDELAENIRELDFQKAALDEHAIVSITDVSGTITYVNEKFCSISGYSRDELIGQNHRMLKSDEHSPDFYMTLWRTISDGDIWRGNIKNLNKDGSYYWVDATIVPFLDEAGKPFQYVAIRTDITDRIDAARRAEIAEAEAIEANQAKSEFLSAMSHELRTPMNAILGFAQLLRDYPDQPLSEEQSAHVKQIVDGGQHLLGLVNEILDLSRIEAGRLEIAVQPVTLADFVHGSLNLLRPLAEERQISISVGGGISPVMAVDADPDRLKQVLLNLVSNAVKYNRDGGKVVIDACPIDDNAVRISIEDTGIGISESRRSEVFRPFSRLGAEASKVEGTGIGLTISRQLIEAMGGAMDFDSVPDEGSTFWIELPLSETIPT